MEDIIDQLTASVAGMTPEEIADQLAQCPNLQPDDVAALAPWLEQLAGA